MGLENVSERLQNQGDDLSKISMQLALKWLCFVSLLFCLDLILKINNHKRSWKKNVQVNFALGRVSPILENLGSIRNQ